ncbi:septum site-determining protein MinC [Aquincola sp. S2]|uniref:Probable septum site-determining protein MinC n=1 Tax=Pseudaquabacterium terrae TaxID=2732868 RepID=A0ABX2EJM4_9BURK|nr:septum site-determining protein MinC [Aquabacterium terrae]NRF68862.1 septum site-determining protein MinC [Aquabacterium terrae]
MAFVISASPPFDLKSTAWTLTALRLQTTDLAAFAAALAARVAEAPGLFDDDPLVLDLSPLRDDAAAAIDFDALLACLRRHRLVPIAVQGGNAVQTAAARAAGLAEALDAAAPQRTTLPPLTEVVREVEVVKEIVKEIEVLREVPGAPVPTMIVDKPLRSGQRVYAKGGDLIVTAVVSFGAEVIADGHVHVYAPLRGRAIAGARGDTSARIFSTCLEPQLVAIAGIYRTTETALPAEVLGKPAVVRLDGERIRVEPLTA